MILSHGNAALERGFSVNKEILVENQQERSLIAQRRICDAFHSSGVKVEDFEVSKELIEDVRKSHSTYQSVLAEDKKNKEKLRQSEKNKEDLTEALAKIEVEREKIMSDAVTRTIALDKEAKSIRKKAVLKDL